MWQTLQSLRFPLKFKLMALFLAVTLIPLGITTFVATKKLQRDELRQARSSQNGRVNNTVRLLDEYLQGLADEMSVAGYLPEIRRVAMGCTEAACKDTARATLTALQRREYRDSVELMDTEGTTSVAADPKEEGSNAKYRPYFQEAVKGAKYVSDISIASSTKQPVIYASAPVFGNNNQVVGVIRQRVKLDGLLNRITDEAGFFGAGFDAMLVDQWGLRLAMSDSSKNVLPAQGGLMLTATKDIPDDVRNQQIAEKRWGRDTSNESSLVVSAQPELSRVIDSGNKGNAQISGSNGSLELSYATLSVKPWKYVVTVPSSVATKPARSVAQLLTVIGLIAAAVGLLFSLTITRPIGKLAKVTDAVSMGNTNVSVDVGSNDEIGDLAASISRMVVSVRYLMHRAEQTPAGAGGGSGATIGGTTTKVA